LLEALPDGMARVRCAGTEIRCRTSATATAGPVLLSVRRRCIRGGEEPGSLPLRGTVAGAVLLGDEREVVLDIPQAGRIVARVDARNSGDLTVGSEATFHASADEVVLVPDDDRASLHDPRPEE
jgi:hypothetical protein